MVACQSSGSAWVVKPQATLGLVSHSRQLVAAIRFRADPGPW